MASQPSGAWPSAGFEEARRAPPKDATPSTVGPTRRLYRGVPGHHSKCNAQLKEMIHALAQTRQTLVPKSIRWPSSGNTLFRFQGFPLLLASRPPAENKMNDDEE